MMSCYINRHVIDPCNQYNYSIYACAYSIVGHRCLQYNIDPLLEDIAIKRNSIYVYMHGYRSGVASVYVRMLYRRMSN